MKSKFYLFDFVIKSDIFVSMAAASLIFVSQMYVGAIPDYRYSLFVFFSTLLGYNYIRVFEKETCYFCFKDVLSKQPQYVVYLLAVAVLGSLYYAVQIGPVHLLILLPAFFLTAGYVIPVLRYKKQWISFRDYPNLKLISIALAWAIVSVLFPLQKHLLEINIWIIFIQRFFLIVALAIPFDVRDLQLDKQRIVTLPQQIGVPKTIGLGILSLLLFTASGLQLHLSASVNRWGDLFVAAISLLFLALTKKNQSKYFASFWVESVPILWLVFIYLLGIMG